MTKCVVVSELQWSYSRGIKHMKAKESLTKTWKSRSLFLLPLPPYHWPSLCLYLTQTRILLALLIQDRYALCQYCLRSKCLDFSHIISKYRPSLPSYSFTNIFLVSVCVASQNMLRFLQRCFHRIGQVPIHISPVYILYPRQAQCLPIFLSYICLVSIYINPNIGPVSACILCRGIVLVSIHISYAGHTRSGRPVSFACTVMPATGRRSVCRVRHTFQLKLYRRPERVQGPAHLSVKTVQAAGACVGSGTPFS